MNFARQMNAALTDRYNLGHLGHVVWPPLNPNTAPALGDIGRIDANQVFTTQTANAPATYGVHARMAERYPLPMKRIDYGVEVSANANQGVEVPVEGVVVGMDRSFSFDLAYSFVLEAETFHVREIEDIDNVAAQMWTAMCAAGKRPRPLDYLVIGVVEVDVAYFAGSQSAGGKFDIAYSAEVPDTAKVSAGAAFNYQKTVSAVSYYPPAAGMPRVPVALQLLRWRVGGKADHPVRS